ncbi:unnamed protein product [Owenia fusiformis]|uniref:peptidylprolyl isomerase n=1 Tax=Owenia fusiformis TaxID=6347 RepID=A0A8J1XT03_OWEFU|nr:unnamed protein product [Owenia fusiformis]
MENETSKHAKDDPMSDDVNETVKDEGGGDPVADKEDIANNKQTGETQVECDEASGNKNSDSSTEPEANNSINDQPEPPIGSTSGNNTTEHSNDAIEESNDKEEEWMQVLGNDSLLKKIVEKGDGRETRPVGGEIVTISCVEKLESDKIVDINSELTFTLGDGDVVQALDICLSLMERNEKAIIKTDAKYAYGEKGRKPDIPPDAKLTYEVQLLKVQPTLNVQKLSIAERITKGDAKRERGNYYYTRSEFTASINSYNKALSILDDSSENHGAEETTQLQSLLETRLKCYNNLAAAQLKVDANDAAIKSCEFVLRVQPENVKALFRKGKALAAKLETSAAIACLRKAVKLEPETKIIHAELSKLVNKQKKEEEKEKDLYKKMIGADKLPEVKPSSSWTSKWPVIASATAAALISVGFMAYRYG